MLLAARAAGSTQKECKGGAGHAPTAPRGRGCGRGCGGWGTCGAGSLWGGSDSGGRAQWGLQVGGLETLSGLSGVGRGRGQEGGHGAGMCACSDPSSTGPVPGVHGTISGTRRAARTCPCCRKSLLAKEWLCGELQSAPHHAGPCPESWPPHCGWATARGSSKCLWISTAAGQHLTNPGPVFADLLGAGTGHALFGLILPASLGWCPWGRVPGSDPVMKRTRRFASLASCGDPVCRPSGQQV